MSIFAMYEVELNLGMVLTLTGTQQPTPHTLHHNYNDIYTAPYTFIQCTMYNKVFVAFSSIMLALANLPPNYFLGKLML